MLGAAGGGVSANKRSMQIFKDRANDVRYLRPHEDIMTLPGTADTRVFVLGPPKDPDLLKALAAAKPAAGDADAAPEGGAE